jgi:hypothetical protein
LEPHPNLPVKHFSETIKVAEVRYTHLSVEMSPTSNNPLLLSIFSSYVLVEVELLRKPKQL